MSFTDGWCELALPVTSRLSEEIKKRLTGPISITHFILSNFQVDGFDIGYNLTYTIISEVNLDRRSNEKQIIMNFSQIL